MKGLCLFPHEGIRLIVNPQPSKGACHENINPASQTRAGFFMLISYPGILMQKVFETFLDPVWWISVVVVGLFTSALGPYIANWTIKLLSTSSSKIKSWQEMNDTNITMEAITISTDPTLILVQYMRVAVNCIFFVGFLIVASILYFIYQIGFDRLSNHGKGFILGASISVLIPFCYTTYKTFVSQIILNKALSIYQDKNVKKDVIIEHLAFWIKQQKVIFAQKDADNLDAK